MFEGNAEIVLADGTVAVTASRTFMKVPIDRIVDGDFADQWFPDPLDAPATVDV